jgi:hypothetical protein
MGQLDTPIAAQALAPTLVLVSHNERAYSGVVGLGTEN